MVEIIVTVHSVDRLLVIEELALQVQCLEVELLRDQVMHMLRLGSVRLDLPRLLRPFIFEIIIRAATMIIDL